MNFEERINHLLAFAEAHEDKKFNNDFIQAYLKETAFTYADIEKREIIAPQKLITLFAKAAAENQTTQCQNRSSLGTVAILLPKNGIGLTAAKSLSASFLMGNHTIVKMPGQLTQSGAIYEQFVTSHLPHVSFASGMSSRDFLIKSLKEPSVKAVVIYGDDSWISQYKTLALNTGTKLIFEGPGKDPQVIYPGADIEKAVTDAVFCGLVNGGQSCSAFERFFVHEQVHDAFAGYLTEILSKIECGHPKDLDVKVGPIKSSRVLMRIIQQVEESLASGSSCLLGGKPKPSGYQDLMYFQPTILTGCHTGMSVMRDETFGPVFPIVPFSDDSEALMRQLDSTFYGLNASIYGEYPDKVKSHLEATHRNTFTESCFISPENIASKLIDGGFKRSAFIWETSQGRFRTRHGRRQLANELSYSMNLQEINEHND